MFQETTKFQKLANAAMKLQTDCFMLGRSYPATEISKHLDSAASIISDVITNIHLAQSKLSE